MERSIVTHLGLQLPSFTFEGVLTDKMFERIAETAVAAESAAFDSFWVMDHYHQIENVGPEADPMLEAYTLLGGVGARTSRIELGVMVTGVTYRNPAFLAKVVTTLDVVSAGRAILGIGAAWNESESRTRSTSAARCSETSVPTTPAPATRSTARSTCRSRCDRAARHSSSAGAASRRRSGSSRDTRTCGTGSATSICSDTSSTSSRGTARTRAAIRATS